MALSYDVDYDGIIQNINSYPWNAISLIDYSEGTFVVSAKIEEMVLTESSIYGTTEQAEEFEKLDVLLEQLNEYCTKYKVDKNDMNNIAANLHCKYIQLEDRSHRIVPYHRALVHIMERGVSAL